METWLHSRTTNVSTTITPIPENFGLMVPYALLARADQGDLAYQQTLRPRQWFWFILSTHRRNLLKQCARETGISRTSVRRIIKTGYSIGRKSLIEFSPRSPDLTPLDYYLWVLLRILYTVENRLHWQHFGKKLKGHMLQKLRTLSQTRLEQ